MIAYRKDKGTGKNFTMKKVLLSDIARECGLSVSTVSRVLSGDDSRRIRQETRDLIYRKADELGYIREKPPQPLLLGNHRRDKDGIRIISRCRHQLHAAEPL